MTCEKCQHTERLSKAVLAATEQVIMDALAWMPPENARHLQAESSYTEFKRALATLKR